MGEPPAIWPDLFTVKQFLEPGVCRKIVAELSAAQSDAATVYGRTTSGAVEQNIRKTLRIRPSVATVESLVRRLWALKDSIEEHFAVALSECEDPQFLRYREGDFFVAHQDGNTGMMQLDTERRLVSTVLFLSRESDSPQAGAHCGGSLVFGDYRTGSRFHMIGEPGMLVAFRAETTHEITPVTHGERYSIVSWYR
ncbi:MAG TPA: 2OG-Fe(II) oxygenase [Pyrinomonadaceae bacterium]|nr:2OG-Fe(II) oxygenase [Pyrinomonadaceae bacterium]